MALKFYCTRPVGNTVGIKSYVLMDDGGRNSTPLSRFIETLRSEFKDCSGKNVLLSWERIFI